MATLTGSGALTWRRWNLETLGYTLLSLVLAFLVIYPLLLLFFSSFQINRPGEALSIGLDGWIAALSEPGMRQALANTVALTLVRQMIAFPVAIILAWLLARTDLPGRDTFEFLFWIAFFLPSLAVTQGWILLLDPEYGLINQLLGSLPFFGASTFNIYSWWGIIWVHSVGVALAVKVMLLTPAFRQLDTTFEEASLICGAGRIATLCRVIVPVMTPTVLVVLLMSIIRSLEAFEIELILGAPQRIDVYSTKIYRLLQQEPPLFAPATALSVLILLFMVPLIALQRWYTGRRRFTTVTGQFKGGVIRLRRWKWPALAFVAIPVCLLTVIPLCFLLLGTFMRLYGFFNIPQPWTLKHWQTLIADPVFLRSCFNTLVLAFGTAVVSVFFYSGVAYIIARTRFWGRVPLDYISWLLFALPGIILGLGYLWLFLGVAAFRPLYGGIVLLILASTLSAMTLGVQILKSAMIQLGADLEEASWVVGGSKWQTYRLVVLPILSPVLLLVGAISFVSTARNISHLALLVTSSNRPLAVLQLDYMAEGRYEVASVVGVVVVVMTIGVCLLARCFGLGTRLKGTGET
jgi:iron(III) transport system permease protein